MDQPPAVALTAFADAWPRAFEMEIGTALCAIGVGRTLTFFDRWLLSNQYSNKTTKIVEYQLKSMLLISPNSFCRHQLFK